MPHQPVTDLYASSVISLLPLNAAAKSLGRQTGRASLSSYYSASASSNSFCVRFQKSHRQGSSSARCSLNKVIVPLCARFAYANIAVFLDFVSGSRADRLSINFVTGSRADRLSINFVTGSRADRLSINFVTGSRADRLSINFVTGSRVSIFVRKTLLVRPRDRVEAACRLCASSQGRTCVFR